MPVSEQIQALGDWSIRFKPDTPLRVREACWHAHSSVVITPGHMDVAAGDNQIMAAARYTGVLLSRTAFDLAGPGLAWWLGDSDDQGAMLSSFNAFSSATYSTVYTFLATDALVPGSFPAGGSVTWQAGNISFRSALDTITATYGHEWRISADFTLDVGPVEGVGRIYSNPTVMLTPGGGRSGVLEGVDARFNIEVDWQQNAQQVKVQGRGGIGESSTTSSTYRGPLGDTYARVIFLSDNVVAPGFEGAVADYHADQFQDMDGRQAVTVDVRETRIDTRIECGDLVYAYDPVAGLIGDVVGTFAGRPTWSVLMRVSKMTWPVCAGMGVYHRVWHDGDAAPTLTDLTPYVEFEDPAGATLEVISRGSANRWSL